MKKTTIIPGTSKRGTRPTRTTRTTRTTRSGGPPTPIKKKGY